MNRPFSYVFAFMLVSSLVGCTTVNREAAVKLADQGAQISQGHREFLVDSHVMLQLDAEGRLLTVAAQRAAQDTDVTDGEAGAAPVASADDEMVKLLKERLNLIARLDDVMSTKYEFLSKLEKTYTSFGELSRYDASAEFAEAAQELANAGVDHAEQMVPLTGPAAGIVGPSLSQAREALTGLAQLAGGYVGSSMQQKRIKSGSSIIRQVLEQYQVLIEGEKETFQSLYFQSYAYDREKVASGLIALGLARPDDLLSQHVERLGLTYVPQGFNAIKDRSYLERNIADVLGYRFELEGRVQRAAIDELYNGVDSLIVAHRQLEQGEPVSIQQLVRHLVILRKHMQTLGHLYERYQKFAPYTDDIQALMKWHRRYQMWQEVTQLPQVGDSNRWRN